MEDHPDKSFPRHAIFPENKLYSLHHDHDCLLTCAILGGMGRVLKCRISRIRAAKIKEPKNLVSIVDFLHTLINSLRKLLHKLDYWEWENLICNPISPFPPKIKFHTSDIC